MYNPNPRGCCDSGRREVSCLVLNGRWGKLRRQSLSSLLCSIEIGNQSEIKRYINRNFFYRAPRRLEWNNNGDERMDERGMINGCSFYCPCGVFGGAAKKNSTTQLSVVLLVNRFQSAISESVVTWTITMNNPSRVSGVQISSIHSATTIIALGCVGGCRMSPE